MKRAKLLVAVLAALVTSATALTAPAALAEPPAPDPSCSGTATLVGAPLCTVDYQSSRDVTYRGQVSPGSDFTGTLEADLCTTAIPGCVALARHRFVGGAAVPSASDIDTTAVARAGTRYVLRVFAVSQDAVGSCAVHVLDSCFGVDVYPDAVGHFSGALVPVAGNPPLPGVALQPSSAWTTPGRAVGAGVQITPASWFAEPLTITVSGLPPGATYVTWKSGALGSTENVGIGIYTVANTPPGTYTLTVKGMDANGVSGSAPLALTVAPSPVRPWTNTFAKEYAAVGLVNEVAKGVSNCDGARPAFGLAPSAGAVCFDVDDQDPVTLRVVINDDRFNPVAAEWYFDADPSPLTSGTMCGSTDLSVPPFATHLWIILGAVEGHGSVPPQPACSQLSNPTHGTVTATGPVKA